MNTFTRHNLTGCVLFVLCCSTGFCIAAGEANTAETALAQREQDLADTQERLQEALKGLTQAEHDAMYKDPELMRLREESKALEAEQLELRRQIQSRLLAVEAVREMHKVRKKLFQERDEIVKEISVLKNELASEQWKASDGE